jgi:hypothetical protein
MSARLSIVAELTMRFEQYPLFFGKSQEHRKKALGTITIRLRIKIYYFRKALLVGAIPPPQNYISVAEKS